MSPSDTLHALLDERGIEWKEFDSVHPITVWHDGQFSYEYMERTLLDGVQPYTGEVVDGTGRLEAVIHVCTPEQAIAATVGAGTCRLVDNDSGPDMHCTACGGGVDDEYRYFMDSWGYSRCPHCGARIIKEETE